MMLQHHETTTNVHIRYIFDDRSVQTGLINSNVHAVQVICKLANAR